MRNSGMTFQQQIKLSCEQTRIQIDPFGILVLDKVEFPGPPPALNPFLTRDGKIDIRVMFKPDEVFDAILVRKPFNHKRIKRLISINKNQTAKMGAIVTRIADRYKSIFVIATIMANSVKRLFLNRENKKDPPRGGSFVHAHSTQQT